MFMFHLKSLAGNEKYMTTEISSTMLDIDKVVGIKIVTIDSPSPMIFIELNKTAHGWNSDNEI
jgi:hypothetical protein